MSKKGCTQPKPAVSLLIHCQQKPQKSNQGGVYKHPPCLTNLGERLEINHITKQTACALTEFTQQMRKTPYKSKLNKSKFSQKHYKKKTVCCNRERDRGRTIRHGGKKFSSYLNHQFSRKNSHHHRTLF